VCGSVKALRAEAPGKPSLNRAQLVARARRETARSTHEQVESRVIPRGGPNPSGLKTGGMTCGGE
jgi:hypothetical protein